MIEGQALLSVREETVAELTTEPQSEGRQEELLDTLCSIDKQLGDRALIVVGREYYQAPTSYPEVREEITVTQQETLF